MKQTGEQVISDLNIYCIECRTWACKHKVDLKCKCCAIASTKSFVYDHTWTTITDISDTPEPLETVLLMREGINPFCCHLSEDKKRWVFIDMDSELVHYGSDKWMNIPE